MVLEEFHARWVLRHQGIVDPQVADTEGLYLWWVAVNILNKPLVRYQGIVLQLWVGQQTKKSVPLKPITLLYIKQGVGLGRLL